MHDVTTLNAQDLKGLSKSAVTELAAALLAQRMGFPIGEVALASNANDVLPRFFAGGDYAPHATLATLANAMDVGAPSNFERLRHWFADDAALRSGIHARSVDDATIRAQVAAAPAHHGIVACPHTACGLAMLDDVRSTGDTRPWAVVATAHPAKFETIVEPLVGHAVPPPPALADCLARPAHGEALAAARGVALQAARFDGAATAKAKRFVKKLPAARLAEARRTFMSMALGAVTQRALRPFDSCVCH